jgi:hypothetical protein
MDRLIPPWIISVSGVCQNLSAAWFGLAFVTPNFTPVNSPEGLFLLTLYTLFGMLFLVFSVRCEQILHYD